MDLGSFRSDNLFPDLEINGYGISPNGKRVVLESETADGTRQLWVAALDRRSPPQPVPAPVPLDQALFASDDEIFFRSLENGKHYLERARLDGSGRRKVRPEPIIELINVSPDRNWLVFGEPLAGEGPTVRMSALSADGTRGFVVCNSCRVQWSSDARTVYFNFFIAGGGNQTVAVPTSADRPFPPLPSQPLTYEDALKLPGARRLDNVITPSPQPGVFAYEKQIVQRNIYRIPIR